MKTMKVGCGFDSWTEVNVLVMEGASEKIGIRAGNNFLIASQFSHCFISVPACRLITNNPVLLWFA